MGMTRNEIDRKLDEIVDFAGVERYLDTPVKRYSSGMTVRLGFSIAAHLEPDILVVDEVLAVGDAEFQKKAIGKMQDVSKGEGRTVLFVSHNMGAVSNLCNRGLVLDRGISVFLGNVNDAIMYYNDLSLDSFKNDAIHESFNGKAIISSYNFLVDNIFVSSGYNFPMGKKLGIALEIKVNENMKDMSISIDIKNLHGELISHLTNEDGSLFFSSVKAGEIKKINIVTDKIFFTPGFYVIDIWVGISHLEGIYAIRNAFNLFIEQSDFIKRTKSLPKHMKCFLNSTWVDEAIIF